MTIIKGDLLCVEKGIITHQVNCKGVMNAGLAKKLRIKFPNIYPKYRQFCLDGLFKPGMIQLCKQSDSLYICNLAGQNEYGTDKRYTDYQAVKTALTKLENVSQRLQLPIYIPYNMGCNLGGGDWNVIFNLINAYCSNVTILQLCQKDTH